MTDTERFNLVWKLELTTRTIGITYCLNQLLYLITTISKLFRDNITSILFASFTLFLYAFLIIGIVRRSQYRKLPENLQFEIDCKMYPDIAEAYEVDTLIESHIDKPVLDLLERCRSYANVEIGNNVLVLYNKYRYQIILRFNDTILSAKALPNRHIVFKKKNVPYKTTILPKDFRNPI